MTKISIALLTHNERRELERLTTLLARHGDSFDEIVVVDDGSDAAFQDLLDRLKATLPMSVYRRALRKNFGAQRSFLFERCTGDVLFWLDPDELPAAQLLCSLRGLARHLGAQGLDAAGVPRFNLCGDEELEAAPAELLSRLVSDGTIPEWQPRIVRKQARLAWTGHVHERLLGIERGVRLPDGPGYALLHYKTHARQAAQNGFYRTIHMRYLDKLSRNLGKRLHPSRRTAWRQLDEADMVRIREMGSQGPEVSARLSTASPGE